MSPKECSLAFDEAVKEFEVGHYANDYEPELKVIVNPNYIKSSASFDTLNEVIRVQGKITVSF